MGLSRSRWWAVEALEVEGVERWRVTEVMEREEVEIAVQAQRRSCSGDLVAIVAEEGAAAYIRL